MGKHFQKVVRIWFRELTQTSSNRKLTFMYLANDVVQNSKKKYPEYAKEFSTVMKSILEHLSDINLDEKTIKSIGRLINIWNERSIFEGKIQTDLSRIWTTKTLEKAADNSPSLGVISGVSAPPPIKKSKMGSTSNTAKK